MKKPSLETDKAYRKIRLLEATIDLSYKKTKQFLSGLCLAITQHRLQVSILTISGVMALIALVASIFLARLLPNVVFGKFGFVIVVAPLLSVISLFGKNVWLLRLIRSNESRIRWKPLARRVILESSGATIVILTIVFLSAGYSVSELALILLIGLTHTATYLLASCLRGLERDILGLISVRLIPLFLVGIVALCYLTGYRSLVFVLGLLTLGHAVQFIFALYVVSNIKDGDVAPELAGQTSGGPIFFYNLSTLLFLQSDRLVCQFIFGFDGYAIYHAAKILTRPIHLALETMDYYSLPRLVTPPYAKKVKRLFCKSTIVAALLGLAYLIWGNTLFEYLFGDKFGSHRFLILSLALLELIALIQVPLANLIQASGRKKQLLTTGMVGIATLLVTLVSYAFTYRMLPFPMEMLPLCVGVAYIVRAMFIIKSRGIALNVKE